MAAILDRDRMVVECRAMKADGLTIVLTNGCFDTFHAGHLATLRFAKRQGDMLIVAVNTDEAVRALKGPYRPLYPLAQRMEILAALEGVDYVVPFGTAEDPSVEPLVAALAPDVLVKGGDYTRGTVVGGAVVEERGGRVVIAPVVPGCSTTETTRKIGQEVLDAAHQVASPPWVFVDMDGVIADPFTPMARLLRLDISAQNLKGEYNLGKFFGLPDDYFAMFAPEFWEAAPWMTDGQKIWLLALRYFVRDRVLLCSSPTRESSSPMGKLRWIERNLGEEWCRRYCFTPVKEAMDKNAILIDDCDANVEAFEAAGGRAVLVPRPWNSLWHTQTVSADFVPSLVEEELQRMLSR